MERRQHELALGEVRVLVEEDHGVGAHEGLQNEGALARMQHLGRGLEDLLHLSSGSERCTNGGLDRRRTVKRLP
jgi:hypothetical protein